MRHAALMMLLLLPLGGCTEKNELRELCASATVGDQQFETPAIQQAVTALRQAQEAEEIIANLTTRRKSADERRQELSDQALAERAKAEAMSLDDKNARRKAILEVTAMELDAQKLSEEVSRYHADILRNQDAAKKHRRTARAALDPLVTKHGVDCQKLLTGPKPVAP